MIHRIFSALVLAAALCAACSEPEKDTFSAPAGPTTRVTLLSEGNRDVAVYAFRLREERYLFDTLFKEGWTPEGTLSVRLPAGRYKFLFASGAGEHLSLQPEPQAGATAWGESRFTLRENPADDGTCLPADELFLQFPAADANTVYTVEGTDLTVEARLTRAVGRIGITIKRGYRNGTEYVEVPYTKPQSVLDEIDRIELTARNTGMYVTPEGYGGTADIAATFSAADFAAPTDEGFAQLEGPLFLPQADGRDIPLEIKVVPATNAPFSSVRLQLTGKAERNKRLEVILWITSDYPGIEVEIETAPIDRTEEGDSGIWQ